MTNVLHTKFGNARISDRGYYRITSRNEGNVGKYLHRLIFEDFYGWIPEGYHVHHKNGNKLDNCIMNLQLIRKDEHHRLHQTGETNSMYGKTGEKHHNYGKHPSPETLKKLSESHMGQVAWNKGKSVPQLQGENHPQYKDYARIIKGGTHDGKQVYTIKRNMVKMKSSYKISKLIDWFKENYPNEELSLEGLEYE